MRLHTRAVQDCDEIRAFFDAIADRYGESHGDAQRLLERRLALIRRLIGPNPGEVLLDVGCGPGVHLLPLSSSFRRAIGVDLSAQMIAAAARARNATRGAVPIELHVANAEDLSCVRAQSVAIALCIGALEHMPDKPAVLAEINRLLEPGGRFVCLTVNGDQIWYRRIAPRLGYDVKHLSTDGYVGSDGLRALLHETGFVMHELGYWNFVARADMPAWAGRSMQMLDRVGRAIAPRWLRGGLYACALKAN